MGDRRYASALVTGGGGFIGSWLIEALLSDGVATTAVGRLDEGSYVPPGAEFIRGDILELDLAGILIEREVDIVFHLAGTSFMPDSMTDPVGDLRANIETTLRVLEAVRGARASATVCYASSAAVYGGGITMPMEEDHPKHPASPYGVSKLAAEDYLELYARLFGLSTLSVRPFSVYGPRQHKLVVYDLLRRVHSGEDPLEIEASADITRDFVFVTDVAKGMYKLALRAPAHGEAYNLASGSPIKLGELIEVLLSVTDRTPRVTFTNRVRPGDPLRWEGDPRRAAALGVSCSTSFEEGLRRTYEWYMASEQGS